MANTRVIHLRERWTERGEVQPKPMPLADQVNNELRKIKGKVIDIKFDIETRSEGGVWNAFIIFEE